MKQCKIGLQIGAVFRLRIPELWETVDMERRAQILGQNYACVYSLKNLHLIHSMPCYEEDKKLFFCNSLYCPSTYSLWVLFYPALKPQYLLQQVFLQGFQNVTQQYMLYFYRGKEELTGYFPLPWNRNHL